MGASASVRSERKASTEEKAAASANGDEVRQRRRSSMLRANEALVMSFIRQHVTRYTGNVTLQELLKDFRGCHNLRRYITDVYMLDLVALGMDAKLALQAKDTANNYLQFWLEASDFALFAASSFRNMRAEEICARYIEHGARNSLPFSRLMVDDILIKKDAEISIASDIFAAAQSEAYEFLEAEVLPLYLKNDGPYGHRMVTKLSTVVRKLRHSNEITVKKQLTEGYLDLQGKLLATLADPLATRALKEYLTSVQASDMLFFYFEVTDFKEMFGAVLLQQAKNPRVASPTNTNRLAMSLDPSSRNFHYFLTRSHKIYDKYLKLGSPLRDLFTDKDLEFLVQRISSTEDLNPSLFDDLREKVFESLLEEHYGEFLKSEQSKNFEKVMNAKLERRQRSAEYIQSRRKMLIFGSAVAALSSTGGKVKVHEAPVAAAAPPDPPDVKKGELMLPLNDSELEDLLTDEKKELMEMLTTNATVKFQQFLNENMEAHKLLFWFEIEDFKSIPHTQTAFVQGRASKVFDKYIKRGAPMELSLDSNTRNKIVASIDKATLSVFDDAQKAVFHSLLIDDWSLFKQHELYQEYLKERDEKRKATNNFNQFGSTSGVIIELTFLEILTQPIACLSFKKFVETEFCFEPLMFWLEVEEYKRLPRCQYMENRCRKIWNRFIRVGAPMAVNISSDARLQARERMDDPGPLCFQQAEAEVYTFMETYLLPKFRKSAEYLELLYNIEQERRALATATLKRDSSKKPYERLSDTTSTGADHEGPVTLRSVLSSQTGVKFFKEFLKTRHCEENLLFWVEAEDFKTIPGRDFLKIRAKKIVNKYITVESKQQINVPHVIRVELVRNVENPTRSTFQKAQDEIFSMIQKDSFPGFLNSEQFTAYMEVVRQTQETDWRAILRRSAGASKVNSYIGAAM